MRDIDLAMGNNKVSTINVRNKDQYIQDLNWS